MYKSFRDICLEMTDEEYYANDGTIHHSALSTFANKGFECIPHLHDPIESDAILRGSIVDELLTSGIDTFNKKYYIGEFPNIKPEMAKCTKALFDIHKDKYNDMCYIPDNIIVATMTEFGIYTENNWKEATKANKLREVGNNYYKQLYLSDGKIMVSNEMYGDCIRMVNALKTNGNTSFFFQDDNPFDNTIERVFQPVFRETIDGITYTIKPDELVVDHRNKRVIATDLKTTGKPEYKFAQSFVDWGYSMQSRLYWRVVRQVMDRDEYFKDFKLTNWYFIVVNKDKLCPLIWEDIDTQTIGTLYYGKNKQIEIRDPFDVAKELKWYMDNPSNIPKEIDTNKPNSLTDFLNKL